MEIVASICCISHVIVSRTHTHLNDIMDDLILTFTCFFFNIFHEFKESWSDVIERLNIVVYIIDNY